MNEAKTDEQPGAIGVEHEPETLNISWLFWRPLVITTAIYCILVFACSAMVVTIQGAWFFTAASAVIFAQSQLTAIYAALGPESYWKRLAISQACLIVVFLSFVGGFFLGSGIQPISNDLPNAIAIVLLASSLGSQATFGFLRIVGGWRVHKTNMPRGNVYSIGDILVLMMFLAISLSILNAFAFRTEFDDTDNIPAFLLTTAGFVVGTLVYGVPTLLSTFRLKESENGCVAQLIIVVVLAFMSCMPFVALGAVLVIGPIIGFLVGCSIFTWAPLLHMRESDFVLSNRTGDGRKEMPSEAKSILR